MRLIALLPLLQVALASPPPLLCKVESIIVSTLSKQAQATTYCSSFLGIKTVSTTTTVSSITPASTLTTTLTLNGTARTATVTETTTTTSTQTSVVTATDQTTNTVTNTITSTQAVAATCVATATTYQPTVSPQITSKKRDAIEARGVPTPDCFRRRQKAFISTLCSCISLRTPTSTITATSTVRSGTTTVTSTTATTPLTTVTTTVTFSTSTSTTSTTTTTLGPATDTVTVTAVQPTQSAFRGLKYYFYENVYNYNLDDPGFTPQTWKGHYGYYSVGLITDLNALRSVSASSSICKSPVNNNIYDCSHLTAVMQGFLYAPTAGTYTITIPVGVDNALYAWTGPTAYRDWNAGNMAFSAERKGSDASKSHGAQATFNLAAAEFLPVTFIFVNGNGPAALPFQITTPDGSNVARFVPPCADSPFVP